MLVWIQVIHIMNYHGQDITKKNQHHPCTKNTRQTTKYWSKNFKVDLISARFASVFTASVYSRTAATLFIMCAHVYKKNLFSLHTGCPKTYSRKFKRLWIKNINKLMLDCQRFSSYRSIPFILLKIMAAWRVDK